MFYVATTPAPKWWVLSVATSKTRRKLTNLGTFAAVTESEDIRGNVTTSTQAVDRNTGTTVSTTDMPTSDHDAVTTVVYGLVRTNATTTDVVTTYEYDALNRRIEARTESAGGARVVSQITHYNDLGQIEAAEDAVGNKTWYTYDSVGRQTAVSNALDQVTITGYDIRGNVTNVTGATYPVSYGYDEMNRLVWMKTYRDGTESGDTTQWHYDPATGLLTSKIYADGKGPSYTYTPDGKLATRTWARGVTTDYGYVASGELATVDYSDGTPDVTYTYDRLGRPVTITDVQGTRTNVYDATTLSLSEEHLPDGTVLSRPTDSLGRPSGLSLGPDYSVSYDFDAYGRFIAVSSSVDSVSSVANYAYVPGSHLVAGYTLGGLTRSVVYEANRDLIASVTNAWNGSLVSSFDYHNDAIGRHTARTDSGGVTNQFGYNDRSEVASSLMGTNVFGYVYDTIGNRLVATNNAEVTTYAANELNQYTSFSNDVVAQPTYDEDGNMTATGDGWHYVWNGENRLVLASNVMHLVSYAYDHQGRMVLKMLSHKDAETQRWEENKNLSYVWDGYNIIVETVICDSSTNVVYNAWGLDINGILQGVGGVGGLLAVVKDSTNYFPSYDANGNITEYVASDGVVIAHREYDSFGGTVVATGNLDAFTHWFSTKPSCPITNFCEYQYRKYNFMLGRWQNRDPIEEMGSLNLYGFAHNAPTFLVDKDGRLIFGWNTLIGGVVGAVVGGVSAAILEGDVWAGVVNGGVTGALIASGVPASTAASIGGGLASFVSSYHSAKNYPNVCDSKFGIALHYTSRFAIGAIGGYYAGVLGGNFSSAMEGTLINQSLTIHGFYIVSTADVVMQGTIDISFTAVELYMISMPEQAANGALGLEPVIQEYNSQIDILYTETPGECLCPSEGSSNGR